MVTEALVDRKVEASERVTQTLIGQGAPLLACALGAYIRVEPYVGRRVESTFTGGHDFEGVVPVYFREDLLTHLRVA